MRLNGIQGVWVHGVWVLLVSIGHSAGLQAADLTSRHAPAALLLRSPEELKQWVARESNEVGAARAQWGQARADARGARLIPNPVIETEVSNFPIGETNPEGLGLEQTLVYGVGLSETIELGKRGPRSEAASLRANAAQSGVRSVIGNRVADVRLALGRAVYAAARATALEASLAAARASADVAKGRLDHQAIAGVDYDRLVLDISALEADTTRSRAEAKAARSICTAMLRAVCDMTDTGAGDLDAVLSAPNRETESIKRRADVAAFRAEQQAAQRDGQLAARQAIPNITLRLAYTRSQFRVSGDLANTISLGLAFPLPIFDHGQHDRAKAWARADEFARRTLATIEEARGTVAALETRRRALETTLLGLKKNSLPRASAILAAEEEGLARGQVDTTDLVLARRQSIGIKLQILDLSFELFAIKNELRRALGLDEASAQGG